MEKSVSLLRQIEEAFKCKEVDIRTYSPLTLAYIGDSIYDVIIRTIVVERGNRSANHLHKTTIRYVNAGTQARMIEALQEFLTEEEQAIYRRGRNAKSYSTAKNASVSDYRKATGMEALLGYLYLKDDMGRVIELVKQGIHCLGMEA
ncbi:MAG: ribonuclease III [Kineothrix sp.]|nr:ribonuclease III [Kineothrix sp.]NBI89746.1 ribonuclease III [Lachnospiraceae bacterium]